MREQGGAPLTDGDAATFLYLGRARSVHVQHWMDIFPTIPPLQRLPNADVWWCTVELPAGSRIEYKLAVKRVGGDRLVLDPLNPGRAGGPFGSNSEVVGPGYERSPWSRRRTGVPEGSIVDLPVVSDVYEETRACRLYVPADYRGDRVPLVVAQDGSEYLNYAAMATVLDNLNVEHPVAALLMDPDERLVEYGADPAHGRHLVEEALPAAAAHVEIDPDRVVGVGASFGAVASLAAARNHPGTFSALVLQSGSFVEALGGPHRRTRPFLPVITFMEELHADPGELPPRIHLSCGQFDGLIEDNHRMRSYLSDLGIEVGWEERPDGHHWGLWRDLMGTGLGFALASTNSPPAEES